MRSPRCLLVVLLALAAVVMAAAGPAQARRAAPLKPVSGPLTATIGIADQKASLFADPRFGRLGLRQARRSIGWDTMRYKWQVEDVDAWMLAARRAGVTPLITFARSRIHARRHVIPTAEQMRRSFVAFRKRYPWARDFVASNESNHFGEPTGRRPHLAAAYYKAMRRSCPTCRIAGATLVDYPNLVRWAKAFVKAAGETPRYWALHNYISANRFDVTRTRDFLLAVGGEVWITEVGGAVKRPRGQARFPEGVAHAARVTRFIFDDLARLSPRIRRIYLYHWSSGGPGSSWDSGLVTASGRPRPALTVFERIVRDVRAGKAPKAKAKPGRPAAPKGRPPVVKGRPAAR